MIFTAGMQKKVWHIRPGSPSAAKLAEKLRTSSVLAQVLINRSINTETAAQGFLWPKLTELIEPDRMPGVPAAVVRIKKALQNCEKIAIYGDYDVDGITSVAILWHLLTMLQGRVEYYIPHRVDEGYGINDEAVRQLAEGGVKLIITVDCGITACAQAELARQLGVDMIITDHHRPGPVLPDVPIIVHPGIDSCYPNPHSAGAMVALKLAWALSNEYRTGSVLSEDMRQFLLKATTLAALGTIADIVELSGENRVLTSYGLKALNETKLEGVRALIDSVELGGKTPDSYDIAFRLAPTLNAAGRMGHARLAVELLTCDNQYRCAKIAEYLKQQNKQRQQCQRKIQTQARQKINQLGLNHPDRRTIVLADSSWHSGVIGIVASRIVDEFLRPAIMINTANGIAQGSARSVEGFSIYDAISACAEHLVSFGGHEMAAGLKIHKERIPDFAEAIENYAQENMTDNRFISTLEIEGLCSIGDFNESLVKQLRMLEPFGRGNPEPLFATRGVRLIAPPRKVGQKSEHLQISITDNTGSVRCIGFGLGGMDKKLQEAEFFSIAYQPKINTYNGSSNIQFVIEDIQFE